VTSCRQFGEATDAHGRRLTKGGQSVGTLGFEIAIHNLKEAVFGPGGDDEVHWKRVKGWRSQRPSPCAA